MRKFWSSPSGFMHLVRHQITGLTHGEEAREGHHGVHGNSQRFKVSKHGRYFDVHVWNIWKLDLFYYGNWTDFWFNKNKIPIDLLNAEVFSEMWICCFSSSCRGFSAPHCFTKSWHREVQLPLLVNALHLHRPLSQALAQHVDCVGVVAAPHGHHQVQRVENGGLKFHLYWYFRKIHFCIGKQLSSEMI